MVRHPSLPERDRRILEAVVSAYIELGEPVSSLWLAKGRMGVSSATVRNVLARLEAQGFVRQPHTSSGRVPTDLGYRSYVDGFLSERRSVRATPTVEARLRQAATVDDMLAHVSQEVSRASHQVGFAISPSADTTALEHLNFVLLDGGKVLVVLVAAGGHVSHTLLEPSEPYTPTELEQAANYLNSEFRGRTLVSMRQAVIERLREERSLYDALMARALRLASTTLEHIDSEPAVFVQGTSRLLDDIGSDDEDITIEALRSLLLMIEEKARLIRLLDVYLGGDGVTVVIGSENNSAELRRFSLVVSTYSDGRGTGAVGVIGPTRMHYPRAIHAVDSLSRMISRVVSARS
jgi:heat-inducible transcriptional repressor